MVVVSAPPLGVVVVDRRVERPGGENPNRMSTNPQGRSRQGCRPRPNCPNRCDQERTQRGASTGRPAGCRIFDHQTSFAGPGALVIAAAGLFRQNGVFGP